jgi:hypothetical protein
VDAKHTVEKSPDGSLVANCTFDQHWLCDFRLIQCLLCPEDDFEVRVYYGETELRAAVYSLEGEVGG